MDRLRLRSGLVTIGKNILSKKGSFPEGPKAVWKKSAGKSFLGKSHLALHQDVSRLQWIKSLGENKEKWRHAEKQNGKGKKRLRKYAESHLKNASERSGKSRKRRKHATVGPSGDTVLTPLRS